MPRPIRATFDLAAFRENLALARARAPHARTWAVVKANAYGHGLERAVRALDAADGYALLDLNDAVGLREAGVTKPILLLEGVFEADDLQVVGEHGLAIVVHDDEQIALLEAVRLPARVPVYLKLNSGMNRLGFAPGRYRQVFERLARSPVVAGITLMTHFADADGPSGVAEPLHRFEAATARIEAPRSLANSAAILRFPETHFDWVRPGIMLYGCSPFADESAQALGLKPVMTLSAELIARARAPAGRSGRLRRRLRRRKADAARRGGLRLCRRLSAPRADRHADPGERHPHAHRRAGLDGHAHRRPRSGAGGGGRDPGHALG